MPAITADTLSLARVPRAGLGDVERPVLSVTTAPQGYEGEGFPVRRAFAGIAPRMLDTPARQLDSGSQGACSWWCLAAEPKSQRTGSPVRPSNTQRALLSRAHSPMWVLVT